MKPINEMTDQELAEAVAVEVLGGDQVCHGLIQFPIKINLPSLSRKSLNGKDSGYKEMLGPLGSEAIENELKRREWSFCSRYVAGGDLNFFEIWIPERGNLDPDYMSLQKSFYLAIAKAALMAVRGEASHGKD